MQAYKIVMQADRLKEIMPIPKEFEHGDVEVTLKPVPEKFDPKEFRGVGKGSKEEIDHYLTRLRNEWE